MNRPEWMDDSWQWDGRLWVRDCGWQAMPPGILAGLMTASIMMDTDMSDEGIWAALEA